MTGYRRIADLDDLWDGEMSGFCLDGLKILLLRVDGEIHAYEDRCPHLGVLLSRGRLEQGILTCTAHEWQYDARTGLGKNPKTAKLERLPLRIEEGAIWVAVGKGRNAANGRM